MTNFDFITDEDLRASLVADYSELVIALSNGAWKATHVLAGSIIEALLVDYLLAARNPGAKAKDPLKMDLSTLISECRTEGILSDRTEQLSSVVRDYRNLIHPGRLLRLGETVDESTAQVAKALVDIIVKEVEAKRTETYGYTGEQVMDKIEHDPSALAILGHLLKDMRPKEFERLLTQIFPPRYFQLIADISIYSGSEEPSPTEWALRRTASSLEECFTSVYNASPDDVKAKAAQNFVRILREESEANVLAYEGACFRCSELKYLSEDDAKIVKRHILSRFEQRREDLTTLFRVITGIGPYLTATEAADLAQAICNTIAKLSSWEIKNMVDNPGRDILAEYQSMSDAAQAEFAQRWDACIHSAPVENWPEDVEVLESLRNWWLPVSSHRDD